MPDFADTARPLNQLTSKGEAWSWGQEEQETFDKLKEALSSAPALGYSDPSQPYILDTGATNCGVGAVLSQVQGRIEQVIAYFRKTLNPVELSYCVTRRELIVMERAVKHFRPYL